MNWEAIGAVGEIFGAIAVLVTLIYFSLQVRNMQAAAMASSFAQSEEGERELRVLHIAHAGLLLKANSGVELNEKEALILDQIYGAYQSHCFHGFGRSTSLGNDGTPPARNFARILRENPSFLPIFSARNLKESPGPRVRKFAGLVQEYMDDWSDA